ncbi:hypothetical protein AB205_0128000 [Aquarana catesbeiana]|uniref:Uncharacterized protein n=1 Tax=Aquarana catesbeiana TaxID=8400 RepID=A0A2G9RAW5_AQUCT|nr:hypothetical protein AB205_0128000 [Aquarana catesbeiana]
MPELVGSGMPSSAHTRTPFFSVRTPDHCLIRCGGYISSQSQDTMLDEEHACLCSAQTSQVFCVPPASTNTVQPALSPFRGFLAAPPLGVCCSDLYIFNRALVP